MLREQRAFRLSDRATRCVRQLLTLLHKVLRRFPYGVRHESDFSGYHHAAVHVPGALWVRSRRHRRQRFVRPPSGSVASSTSRKRGSQPKQ
jgi:hypothetical protein